MIDLHLTVVKFARQAGIKGLDECSNVILFKARNRSIDVVWKKRFLWLYLLFVDQILDLLPT